MCLTLAVYHLRAQVFIERIVRKMPYKIRKSGDKWAVSSDKGTVIGTHDSKDSAIRQMVAVSKKEGLMWFPTIFADWWGV